MTNSKKSGLLRRVLLAGVVLFVLLQLVPYGRDHSNPPVTGEPPWDQPQTREMFMTACGDCHSHETAWPWYSHVAPVSWLLERDVNEARSHFNVSTWDQGHGHADDAVHEYEEGEMPLWFYTPLHPAAVYGPEDRGVFIAGMSATFGGGSDEHDDHGDHGDHAHPH